MYNRDDQPWYEAIPYGPLTEDIFEKLATSFYDESRADMQKIAQARGIRSGEYLAHQLKRIREQESRPSEDYQQEEL